MSDVLMGAEIHKAAGWAGAGAIILKASELVLRFFRKAQHDSTQELSLTMNAATELREELRRDRDDLKKENESLRERMTDIETRFQKLELAYNKLRDAYDDLVKENTRLKISMGKIGKTGPRGPRGERGTPGTAVKRKKQEERE